MAAYAPDLMFEHGLDIAKGWFQPAALDKSAKLSADVLFTVPRGRVVQLDANKEFIPGVANQAMAIFLLNAETDFDVSNPGTTQGGRFMHHAIAPNGHMSGVVATGGYEIQSTEFDASRTYLSGECLTALPHLSDIDIGGVLTNDCEAYTDPVCGCVSDGVFTNAHGVDVLGFWSCYIPADPR